MEAFQQTEGRRHSNLKREERVMEEDSLNGVGEERVKEEMHGTG